MSWSKPREICRNDVEKRRASQEHKQRPLGLARCAAGARRARGAAGRFLNRELSWLDFNEHVLAFAERRSLPVLERAKFLAIFSDNLDEFFQVRVGS